MALLHIFCRFHFIPHLFCILSFFLGFSLFVSLALNFYLKIFGSSLACFEWQFSEVGGFSKHKKLLGFDGGECIGLGVGNMHDAVVLIFFSIEKSVCPV